MHQSKNIRDFFIKPGEIHVWLVKMDNPARYYSELRKFLSEDEITRLKQYKFELDRQRFIARRGFLRLLLGQYCALPPKSITYQVNPYGKLSSPSCPYSFNLSHSQGVLVFGFSSFPEIGVDIEQVHSNHDLFRLTERWFSPEEQAGLSALPASLQSEAFYHVWTQKEAYIKARGLGLSIRLKDFSVSTDPSKPARLLSIGGGPDDIHFWKLIDVPFEPGWRSAVCVRTERDPVIICSISTANEIFSIVSYN
jgi:4'-phosphopantetheinyl transferase